MKRILASIILVLVLINVSQAQDMAFKSVAKTIMLDGWYDDDLTLLTVAELADANFTTQSLSYWSGSEWTVELSDLTVQSTEDGQVIITVTPATGLAIGRKYRIKLVTDQVTDIDLNHQEYEFEVYDTTVRNGTSTTNLSAVELERRAYQAQAGKVILNTANKDITVYDSDSATILFKTEIQDNTGTATNNPANVYRKVPKN